MGCSACWEAADQTGSRHHRILPCVKPRSRTDYELYILKTCPPAVQILQLFTRIQDEITHQTSHLLSLRQSARVPFPNNA